MTSSKSHDCSINIITHNAASWDNQALLQHDWSRPVSSELVEAAKKGVWEIHITKKPLPDTWLPKQIKSKDVLCLASAGGQQAPTLAAAGAHVIVVDISDKQLEQDRFVAQRDNLTIQTIQGDMANLSMLRDASFDYIIHPISNLYVADINPVWRECYRVLRSGGALLSSFYNPVLFVFAKDKVLEDKGLLKPQYTLPYSDIENLEPTVLAEKMKNHEAIIFGHTLSSQIAGQLEAGFLLSGLYEDDHPTPRFLIEKYMQTMIATRAIKL